MTSSSRLEMDTVVVASEDHVSSTLEDEEVILDLASGTYYGLNIVGQRVWSIIQSPQSVRVICDHIHNEFEVERERVENDVAALLHDMLAENLVQVQEP